ncbi:MAG: hypothetical protein NTX73_05470 [Rhodobacterales bacterium]|nr:hypothetical protein [Rhodobacterales bacterium]
MKFAALIAAAALVSAVSTAVLADEANPTCAEFAAMSPEAQSAAIDALRNTAKESNINLSIPEGATFDEVKTAVTGICEGQAGEAVLIEVLKKM